MQVTTSNDVTEGEGIMVGSKLASHGGELQAAV